MTYGNNVRFRTFQDVLDTVEEFSSNLHCNVFITLEADDTFAFFGNGTPLQLGYVVIRKMT